MRSARVILAGTLSICLSAACGSTVGVSSTQSGFAPPSSGREESTSPAELPTSLARQPEDSARTTPGSPSAPRAAAGQGSGPQLPVPQGSAPSGIPATGPGWDRRNVYVGISLETDASAIGGALGVKTFDFGDQKRAFNIAIAAVNASGGLLGRKIVPIWYDYKSVGEPADQQAAVACATWYEDHRVVAVLNFVAYLAADAMFECVKKHGGTMITQAQFAVQSHLATWSPWINFNGAVVSADRLAHTWRKEFARLGFFRAWDTTRGGPGAAPVKIGVIYYNSEPAVTRAWRAVARILKARGPVAEAEVSDPTKLQSVVVRFRQEGVTHVFLDPLSGLFWPQQAEAQRYRPRLGQSTYNLPQYYFQGVAPTAQLAGSLVAGFIPTADVDRSRDPRDTPGRAECIGIFKKHGYPPAKQGHEVMALTACDLVFLLANSVRRGSGLTLDAIHSGFKSGMSDFRFASTWSGSFSPARPDPLAAFRAATFDMSCQCYGYLSRRNLPVG